MFELQLFDRKGNRLQEGDIVKVSNHKSFSFYSEVKWLEEEQCIAPFDTFTYHSFEKVDKLPEHAVKGYEDRYNMWYVVNPEADTEEAVKEAERYRMSWVKCEHHVKYKSFRIQRVNNE